MSDRPYLGTGTTRNADSWFEVGGNSARGRRLSDFPWTNEQIEQLKKKWAAGKPFSQIAAELGCSRNAAIGKAHRIGLKGPEPKLTTKKIPNPKRLRNATRIMARINKNDPGLATYQPQTVDVVPLNLTFAQLEPGQCKYPYGDRDYLFCGHPVVGERSYCIHHFRLTHKGYEQEQAREAA